MARPPSRYPVPCRCRVLRASSLDLLSPRLRVGSWPNTRRRDFIVPSQCWLPHPFYPLLRSRARDRRKGWRCEVWVGASSVPRLPRSADELQALTSRLETANTSELIGPKGLWRLLSRPGGRRRGRVRSRGNHLSHWNPYLRLQLGESARSRAALPMLLGHGCTSTSAALIFLRFVAPASYSVSYVR